MAKRPSTNRVFQRLTGSIKRQIAAGRLVSGEKLPAEREMARRQKVSRVSVREAYRSLEELGVIAIRRGTDGGAYIAEPGHAAIQQSLSLMLRLGRMSAQELSDAWIIAATIARLAARHAQADDITRLKRVLQREDAAVARPGYAWPHRLRFERAVAACARNLPLTALVNSLADLTGDALASAGSSPIPAAQVCQSHRSILEAIEGRDEQMAYQLMRQHVASIQSAIAEKTTRRRARAAMVPGCPPAPRRAA